MAQLIKCLLLKQGGGPELDPQDPCLQKHGLNRALGEDAGQTPAVQRPPSLA